MNLELNEFITSLILIFFEKGILAIAILLAGFLITKSIERIKISEAFTNEVTKIRIERISNFYDLFSEHEHWMNRLVTHKIHLIKSNVSYLDHREFEEATEKATKTSDKIGFELNQMRFWINDDIYFHTVAQLELFKKMNYEILQNEKIDLIEEYRYQIDTIRMNIDKLIPYLKSKQDLKLEKYDRSFLYEKQNASK